MCDTMPLLPEEIVCDEILSRLPVKSLLRFKCLSKPWRSLIESDRFIEMHYRNSAKSPRVIMSNLRGEGMSRCTLQWLLKESKEGSDPTMSVELQNCCNCVPVGCFNGVVCFYGRRDNYGDCRRFTLWNPATRVSVELPRHNDGVVGLCVLQIYGFGWDETTSAYKVFAIFCDRGCIRRVVRVYSSNTNSWRTITTGSEFLAYGRGVFVRGNLHWIGGRHSQIECFDLERVEFGRIELPVSVYNPRSWLGDIGGNLSLLVHSESSFEVWVMKEYGVKDYWLKFLTFPSTFLSRPMNYVTSPLFGEGPNGEIFVLYGPTLITYSPKDDAFSTATTSVNFLLALVYVESLVSPIRICRKPLKQGSSIGYSIIPSVSR